MGGLERRALQIAVAVGSLVPIGAGMIFGPRMIDIGVAGSPDLDSHFRYLSGLLLAVGLAFASTVPAIETHSARFRLLTAVVVAGGIGRLMSLVSIGTPSAAMVAALAMELLVTPALAVWQGRLARAAERRAP
jgi:hypothetical protein